ncbi:acyl-CoA dehydrogenase family protein, partial [Clostridium estertheticum]
EKYGGWGLSETQILQVQEEFSRGPGGMRMHLHYAADMNWRILDDFGHKELKDEYMDKFADKTIFTCFALTEAAGGSGADLHTMAVKDGDDYIMNGEKTLISHTDCCEFAYVICVTNPDAPKDKRLSAFFVPVNTPGYEVLPMPHMMGCRGAGHAELKFTNMRLNKKYLLGEEGDGLKIAMHSLSVSRAHIAVSNLGMAQRMLEMAIKRAKDRVTFGKPLVKRQAIQQMIADMGTEIYALRNIVYDFAKDYEDGKDIEMKAAMC